MQYDVIPSFDFESVMCDQMFYCQKINIKAARYGQSKPMGNFTSVKKNPACKFMPGNKAWNRNPTRHSLPFSNDNYDNNDNKDGKENSKP